MRIFGYKKENRKQCDNPSELKEATISCSIEELHELVSFLTNAYAELKDYSFPHGACTLQFRDRSKNWKNEDPDFILVIEEPA